MMYLRFAPADYQAICHVCRPLDLAQQPPEILKSRLAEALACQHPDLADRIGKLTGKEQLVLHQFLLGQQQPPGEHGLTARELWVLARAFGPLLFNARFRLPLKRVLMRQFPDLAAKLDRMSREDFEVLCEQVQERTRREA